VNSLPDLERRNEAKNGIFNLMSSGSTHSPHAIRLGLSSPQTSCASRSGSAVALTRSLAIRTSAVMRAHNTADLPQRVPRPNQPSEGANPCAEAYTSQLRHL